MTEISNWLEDSVFLAKGHSRAFLYKAPPKEYLEYVKEDKAPIILIPGIAAKWTFLKDLGDTISVDGYPVYVIPDLGYNFYDFYTSAEIIRGLIDKNDLNNVVIIGHSKGGLIGKYLLVHENKDHRISGLIALATPFSGSHLSGLVPAKPYKETAPESRIIQDLNSHPEVNHKIVSIYATHDNLVSPMECYLPGARNVEIKDSGHHKMLFNKELPLKITESIDSLTQSSQID